MAEVGRSIVVPIVLSAGHAGSFPLKPHFFVNTTNNPKSHIC
jgi:hypothetical protein